MRHGVTSFSIHGLQVAPGARPTLSNPAMDWFSAKNSAGDFNCNTYEAFGSPREFTVVANIYARYRRLRYISSAWHDPATGRTSTSDFFCFAAAISQDRRAGVAKPIVSGAEGERR